MYYLWEWFYTAQSKYRSFEEYHSGKFSALKKYSISVTLFSIAVTTLIRDTIWLEPMKKIQENRRNTLKEMEALLISISPND